MVSHLFFYQLILVALVWLCLMLHWAWPSDPAAVCPTAPESTPPVPKRHREITPFAGLTKKPHCDACAHASDLRSEAPCPPPPRLVPTRGRRRQVDTSTHCCPHPDCPYRGWVGWGNLRAHGCASPVAATFWRPSARSSLASASPSSGSCASAHAEPRAWASGALHGC